MAHATKHDIYFSFFMFTADLRPTDPQYTKLIVSHMKALMELGYTGFDLPIAPGAATDHAAEVKSYEKLKEALVDAKLGEIHFTTNVAATGNFNPSSDDPKQRDIALAYLKSRVDITKALGGKIMAGPIVLPYGVFPVTAAGQPIWSDALQDWVVSRYGNAQQVIEELSEHAAAQNVNIAIEPVDHWETAPPNLVGEVLAFLETIDSPHVGVCIDSAHVTLGSDGPAVFTRQAHAALARQRLHYVHISAPDRGAVHDSWIPWQPFLKPILEGYGGPFLVEVFNAIAVFQNSLRQTRRKFWIPREDDPEPERKSAYQVAEEAIGMLRREMEKASA
jgi:D-psicose/D-tagatose/L-ribulose 3-epimerase